jgi:hypothetical protein
MKELDQVQVIWFSGYYNIGEGFKTDTGEIIMLNGNRVLDTNPELCTNEIIFTDSIKTGSYLVAEVIIKGGTL